VDETPITSLARFIARMSELQLIGQELRPTFWFRGHADASWKLLPGPLRPDFVNRVNQFNVQPNDPDSLRAAIEQTESLINEQFRREGASLFSANAEAVQIYFTAQHHGLPTRLLDWTTNPLAALFFAVSQEADKDGEVLGVIPDWRLTFGPQANPQKEPQPPVAQRHPLVVKTVGYFLNSAERPTDALIVPVLPDLCLARMLKQGACFTLHMPSCPQINESCVVRIPILRNAKAVLIEELRSVRVNWATLYPDLDHVAQEIRDDWKLGPRRRL